MHLNRRSVLRGLGGIMLPLPFLDAMRCRADEANEAPRRFCALYTANGMSLPKEKNKLSDWNWFPHETGRDFKFGNSTKPFEPFRDQLTFLGGLHHPSGVKADPHVCSDMWLTGAPLHDSSRRSYNSVSIDQVVALHTKQFCRQPSLVLSIDAGVGFLSRTGTISFNAEGKPIPAENNPRRVFDRLFRSDKSSLEIQRADLQRRIRIVDAVLENAQSLSRQLGKSDRDKLDQYLTSLSEIESRLEASEKWIDVPIKSQDYRHLDLSVTNESAPVDYYRTMFDLVALAFDADITRSVAFMLNREDGMGISDTFPLKLGLCRTHHQLSHAGDPAGQLDFAKYDLFLAEQIGRFLKQLKAFQDVNGSVLDNSIVLYGSGASTTHKPQNLPTMVMGGANMGLKHGSYFRRENGHLSDLYLSILHALDVPANSFGDSTGKIINPVFTRELVT
ncbi:MAG: DUF1552 domain-containing protein [Planctomycetota bacterium]|nr:DUF1552 domain-containing protein [Planctomycetota bacterium]